MSNTFNPDKFLSSVVKDIPPSGIRKFFDIVNQIEGAISLGVGEPDFTTPWHIRTAAVDALKQGHTYYTSNWGLIELRCAIAENVKKKYRVEYNPEDEILVTVGGSEAVDICIRALVNPGDEVLLPEPAFVCYRPCVEMARGNVVPIVTKMEDNFKLTKEALLEKITDKTKLLVLSFPNNPTGAVMTFDDLAEIYSVIKDRDIMVLSDEIYAELNYSGESASIIQFPGMKDRTVVVNGFSKAYAMTGWRLGYTYGNREIMKVMTKIHQYAIMSSPTISQYAAIEALKYGDSDIEEMREEYNMRRRYLVHELNKMGMECFEPLGAFYVFPSIKRTGMTSEEFCERLLKEQKLALVPGNAFGESGEGHVRISYAYSLENLKIALSRIKAFLDDLRKE